MRYQFPAGHFLHAGLNLIVTDWNVWHGYSTYFLDPVPDLARIAERLVDCGFAECAFLGPNLLWTRGGGETLCHRLTIRPEPNHPRGTLTLPADMSGTYVGECAVQSAWLDAKEKHLFPDSRLPRHLRAFLGRCVLRFGEREVLLYPQVKLYETGILLTEWRVLSGGSDYEIADFVNQHVNLFDYRADKIEVPEGFFRQYVRAAAPRGLWLVLKTARYLRRIDRWIADNRAAAADGDFRFTVVPIEQFDFEEIEDAETVSRSLRFLARMAEVATERAIRQSGMREVRQGWSLGSFWSGRPSVYLIRFRDQPQSSRVAVERFKPDLAKIMYRASALPAGVDADEALGPNKRLFDDYAVFLNKAVTLWVCGSEGAARGTPETNWAGVIYDKQPQAELIEYLYAAHRRLEEQAGQPHRSIRDIALQERQLVLMHQHINESSRFGEITDLLRQSERSMELSSIRERVEDTLRLKAMVLTERQQTTANHFGWLLTVLLGLSGLPALAGAVIEPLWTLLGWWMPITKELRALFSFSLAAAIVVVLVAALWRVTAGRRGGE